MTKNIKFDLLKILIAVYCFFTAMGINIVVFPVILKNNNINETLIGLSVIIELFAGICFSKQIIRYLKKSNVRKFLVTATAIYFAVMMLIFHYINYFLWSGMIFLIGVYWFGFNIIKHSWYNTIITGYNRNFFISLNTIVLSLGFASGSYIVSLLGTINSFNFIISFLLGFVAFIALNFVKTPMPEIKNDISDNVIKYFKDQPFLYFAKFTQEVVTISIMSFIVIYAINIGFKAEQGAIFAGLFMLSAVLNILSAKILDWFNYKNVFLTVSLILNFFLCSLYFFQDSFLVLAISCFIIGFLVSFYFIGCEAQINYNFANEHRVGANNALAYVTNLGGICGCIITGFLMSEFGEIGFIVPSVICQISVILIILLERLKLEKYKKMIVS